MFLRSHPSIDWVNYAGFLDSPFYGLAQKYLNGRACSLMTFGVKGGAPAATKFYDSLKLVKRWSIWEMQKRSPAIRHPQLIARCLAKSVEPLALAECRLSVGIEHVDDIVADLDQALEAAMLVTTKGETDASLL